MKLTDKGLLEDAVQGVINSMEAKGIDMISASVPLAIIKGAPTIEAIPVAWLREKMILADDAGDLDSVDLFSWILQTWQKEQEASE